MTEEKTCKKCGSVFVTEDKDGLCPKCKKQVLENDVQSESIKGRELLLEG